MRTFVYFLFYSRFFLNVKNISEVLIPKKKFYAGLVVPNWLICVFYHRHARKA